MQSFFEIYKAAKKVFYDVVAYVLLHTFDCFVNTDATRLFYHYGYILKKHFYFYLYCDIINIYTNP